MSLTRKDVERAWEFAKKHHDGQKYGNEPYINHVVEVYNPLVNEGAIVACVAILHDVVEDTIATHNDIFREFGNAVGYYVRLLTNDRDVEAGCADGSSIILPETYSDYINRINTSEIARKVKIADLHANLSNNPRSILMNKYINALKALGA